MSLIESASLDVVVVVVTVPGAAPAAIGTTVVAASLASVAIALALPSSVANAVIPRPKLVGSEKSIPARIAAVGDGILS